MVSDKNSKIGTQQIEKLIEESELSLQRLEQLQKKNDRSYTQRASSHVKRNSNHLINLALAGSVFVVALSRLNDKYAYEAEKEELVEKIKGLTERNEYMGQQIGAADKFAADIEQVAKASGGKLSLQLKEALDSFRNGGQSPLSAAADVVASGEGEGRPPMI